jgi:hypothetical protein
MPVHFKKPKQHVDVHRNRGRHFDLAVTSLAPAINELRASGIRNIRQLANGLNDKGLVAPSGGPFTYATTRRVLGRLKALDLGAGPRTLAQAARQRPTRPYKCRVGKPMTPFNSSALKKVLAKMEGSDAFESKS